MNLESSELKGFEDKIKIGGNYLHLANSYPKINPDGIKDAIVDALDYLGIFDPLKADLK